MLFPTYRFAGLAALMASFGAASPTPVDVVVAKPQNDLVYREALELAHQPHLEKRLSAEFDMTKTWENETLFNGWASFQALSSKPFVPKLLTYP